jgi:hypothetical protein
VGGTYSPLNHSALYQPHTKRRHQLNDDYWRAIDPTRFNTPIAERAFGSESVILSHPHLLADQDAMQAVVDACTKLHEQRDELADWAAVGLVEVPERKSHHVGAI